jgi:PhoPQ-activated pathogenicity-related protein
MSGQRTTGPTRPWIAIPLWCIVFVAPLLAGETALDRYVAKRDPEYGWKVLSTSESDGFVTHVLELTSLRWRNESEVDRPIWKHWLTIVRPRELTSTTGFLFIGGGNNDSPPPEAASSRVAGLARSTGTLVAELGMVPNQPLRFTDSADQPRSEDDLIAYSRIKFMATGDETWLARLAMVKSGIRALDAIGEFTASPVGGNRKIEKFVVAGGSKRGWTTWLVGLEDQRVVAMIPLVIDALNSEEITKHHYRAYGFFSSALNDYVRHKLFPQKIGSPEYRAVLAIEDPYQYRDRPRLRIPKFLINAAGDEFFLPDNSQLYFAELAEEKYLRYVPNAKHNLQGSDALESLQAFYESVLNDRPRPKFRWTRQSDGALVVTAKDRPREANLWQATNPQARDFRLDVIGPAYVRSRLEEASPGVYVARVSPPASGFTAFFVELVFDSGGRYPHKFTTDVYVVPDVLPFDFEEAQRKALAEE